MLMTLQQDKTRSQCDGDTVPSRVSYLMGAYKHCMSYTAVRLPKRLIYTCPTLSRRSVEHAAR